MAEPLEWNRYQVFVENRSPAKFSDVPGVVRSLNERPSKSPIESGCRFGETYEDDKESSRKLNTSDAFVGIFFLFPPSFSFLPCSPNFREIDREKFHRSVESEKYGVQQNEPLANFKICPG